MKNLPASETIIDAVFKSKIERGVDDTASYLVLHTVILVELIDRFDQLPRELRVEQKIDEEINQLIHPDMYFPNSTYKDTTYLSMLAHRIAERIQNHCAAKKTAH